MKIRLAKRFSMPCLSLRKQINKMSKYAKLNEPKVFTVNFLI